MKGLEGREWLVGLATLRGWRRNGVEAMKGESVVVAMTLGEESGTELDAYLPEFSAFLGCWFLQGRLREEEEPVPFALQTSVN